MSGKAKSGIGTEVNGGSDGRRSMNHSMLTREYDLPRCSGFDFHFSLWFLELVGVWYDSNECVVLNEFNLRIYKIHRCWKGRH